VEGEHTSCDIPDPLLEMTKFTYPLQPFKEFYFLHYERKTIYLVIM